MTIKIPDSLRIGNQTYAVHIVERQQFASGGEDSCSGWVNYKTVEIFVRNDLAVEHQREVLMHEALHALLAFINQPSGGDSREDFVEPFAQTLDLFLQENREALNGLYGK